jgi:hypothetical protein
MTARSNELHAAHGQHGIELARDDLGGPVGLALLERLADAEDGHQALDWAATNLRATSASTRRKIWRRSEWPDEHVAAADVRSIAPETSPVKAPLRLGADRLGAERHVRCP